MEIGIYVGWGIAAAFIGSIVFLTWRAIRRNNMRRVIKAFIRQQEDDTLQLFEQFFNRYSLEIINDKASKWQAGIFTLSSNGLLVYPIKAPPTAAFQCAIDDIRWFGRPQPYSAGINEIWIHVERKREWMLVRLRLSQVEMADFVRALKPLVDPDLVTAYRRRRPYIHYGPMKAHPAEQDIHGAWTLETSVSLYLMPRHLLILHDEAVQQVISLGAIQQIGALRRLDAPQADGLVRFQTAEAHYAFALKDYEAFASALAEAAKRTLEAPVMQKQKGKDGEWDDVD